MNVGIGEQDPLAGGGRGAVGQGVVLAEPAFGQRGDMHDLQPCVGLGQLVEDRAGGVLRAVVDRDEFPIGVVECQHGRHGGTKGGGLVAGGEDD
jgi:hypothetical protein